MNSRSKNDPDYYYEDSSDDNAAEQDEAASSLFEPTSDGDYEEESPSDLFPESEDEASEQSEVASPSLSSPSSTPPPSPQKRKKRGKQEFNQFLSIEPKESKIQTNETKQAPPHYGTPRILNDRTYIIYKGKSYYIQLPKPKEVRARKSSSMSFPWDVKQAPRPDLYWTWNPAHFNQEEPDNDNTIPFPYPIQLLDPDLTPELQDPKLDLHELDCAKISSNFLTSVTLPIKTTRPSLKILNLSKSPIRIPLSPDVPQQAHVPESDGLLSSRSAKCPSWFTPPFIIHGVISMTKQLIDLDPASEPAAQRIVAARRFWTTQALHRNWTGNVVFLNAPFTYVGTFVTYGVRQFDAGHAKEIFMFVRFAPSSAWLHVAWKHPKCTALLFNKRMKFWKGLAGKRSEHVTQAPATMPHEVALLYFGDRIQEFRKAFSAYGPITRYNRYIEHIPELDSELEEESNNDDDDDDDIGKNSANQMFKEEMMVTPPSLPLRSSTLQNATT
ncbi:uncharacterized protein MONOS_17291 [Monocercomonoides exilis]|uniref:uncharacterized protein n=1 Tax=Monocercomonoides exilis TaxID=2049356 RepID=UPI0035597BB6|nr:hypothetical protein MONOS_17291 [Monocercomonoides exilis]